MGNLEQRVGRELLEAEPHLLGVGQHGLHLLLVRVRVRVRVRVPPAQRTAAPAEQRSCRGTAEEAAEGLRRSCRVMMARRAASLVAWEPGGLGASH